MHILKNKKIIVSLLSFVLLIALFAGCANSYTPETKPESPASESAGSVAGDRVSPNKDGEVMTMMINGSPTDTAYKAYNDFVNSFNESNEYGVTFDAQFYENEQYKTKLTTLMAANNVTDIFFTWELDYLRPFVEGGKAYDITGMLEADQELKGRFQEGLLATLTYDGKLYALPTQSAFTTMFYNKKIFEDNGVTPPTTWDEFLQICETLKNNGVTPLMMQASDAWIPAQLVQQLVNGMGGLDVYNGLLDGSVKWNNPTHVEAGKILQNMVNAGYMQDGFLGMKTDEGRKVFLDGNAAMHYMGIWEISNLQQENSAVYGDISAFSLPSIDPQYSNLPVGSVNDSFAISSQTKNPEAAFGMLKHLLSKENQETLLYDIGRFPATKIDVDRSRVSPLTADCLAISDQINGMTPWLDRAFGAGEGVEFNNTVLAICGGEDSQTAFDNLQKYVETTVSR